MRGISSAKARIGGGSGGGARGPAVLRSGRSGGGGEGTEITRSGRSGGGGGGTEGSCSLVVLRPSRGGEGGVGNLSFSLIPRVGLSLSAILQASRITRAGLLDLLGEFCAGLLDLLGEFRYSIFGPGCDASPIRPLGCFRGCCRSRISFFFRGCARCRRFLHRYCKPAQVHTECRCTPRSP